MTKDLVPFITVLPLQFQMEYLRREVACRGSNALHVGKKEGRVQHYYS